MPQKKETDELVVAIRDYAVGFSDHALALMKVTFEEGAGSREDLRIAFLGLHEKSLSWLRSLEDFPEKIRAGDWPQSS